MNRRKFLAFLAATPLAAVLPLPKTEPVFEWTAVRSPEILLDNRCHPDMIFTHENHLKVIKEFMAEQGEAAGRSFNFVKSREASKILAKADKNVKW